MSSDLGLMEYYGHFILSGVLIFYALLYKYLAKEYGRIDEY